MNVLSGLNAEMKADATPEQLINIDVKISNSRGTAFSQIFVISGGNDSSKRPRNKRKVGCNIFKPGVDN